MGPLRLTVLIIPPTDRGLGTERVFSMEDIWVFYGSVKHFSVELRC